MASQRLLTCLLVLQAKRRMTARELAAELDVSVRTVHRDVQALCAAGVPIYTERGPAGGIVLDDDYRRALANLTATDLRALFAAGAHPLADLGADAPRVLDKLASALPARSRAVAAAARERVLLDHNRWSRVEPPTATLQRLRDACEDDRSIRLRYRDRTGSATERVVDPLGLVTKAGVWYLVARVAGKDYRTFRAERIDGVVETRERFARPAAFDLEAYWTAAVRAIERESFQPYVATVRAGPAAVERLRTYRDVTLREERDDGSVLAVTFPTRDVAIVELLLIGDDLDVLEPPDLRDAIVSAARAALARHAGARR